MNPDPTPLLGGARSGPGLLEAAEKLRQRIVAVSLPVERRDFLRLFRDADIDHRAAGFGNQAGKIRQAGHTRAGAEPAARRGAAASIGAADRAGPHRHASADERPPSQRCRQSRRGTKF